MSFENVTSIMTPAHNEQAVVGRCIESLTRDAGADSYQAIVVANGCSDDTAEVVRQAWERVDVAETDVPSKSNALNLGVQGQPDFLVSTWMRTSHSAQVRYRSSALEWSKLVTAPSSLWGLITIKTRSRLGRYELSEEFPELSQNEPKDYARALAELNLVRRPALWPALGVYLGVNLIARLRATRMHRRRAHDVWERDDTSRQ